MQLLTQTSGNWDLKTKVPQQCEVSGMKLPPYFMEWINLKDIYLNFYNRRVSTLHAMLHISTYSSKNSYFSYDLCYGYDGVVCKGDN